MKWDVFSNRRRKKKMKVLDDIDLVIEKIEKFAPPRYRSERESFYYNYRILNAYLNPLSALLDALSHREHMKKDETVFIRSLFLKLKNFYDIKQKLTIKEAIEDRNLKIKLGDILLFFYNRSDMTMREIEAILGHFHPS